MAARDDARVTLVAKGAVVGVVVDLSAVVVVVVVEVANISPCLVAMWQAAAALALRIVPGLARINRYATGERRRRARSGSVSYTSGRVEYAGFYLRTSVSFSFFLDGCKIIFFTGNQTKKKKKTKTRQEAFKKSE